MELQKQMPVKVCMFGRFSIEYNGKVLTPDKVKSRQLWMLLEYLLVNRKNDIPVEKLADVLWPNHEVENIQGALKNLVYRLRHMLEAVGRTPEREYIVYARGYYSWNNEIPCQIDCEELARLHQIITSSTATPDEIETFGQAAIELYKGDFLSTNGLEEWVVSLAAYYRKLFFDCVYKVCRTLFAREQYDIVDRICTKAITIDPFEEEVHILKMRALVQMSKNQEALSHYEYVTALFYRELGVRPSEDLTVVYKELTKKMNAVENDISIVREKIEADNREVNGAFYCDYEIFKKIYTLQQRSVERTGMSVFVGLISVFEPGRHTISEAKRERAIAALHDTLLQTLRKGDVISRYSATQYIVMLPSLTFENCDVVIKRITSNFNKIMKLKNVEISAKLMPVGPAMRLPCDQAAI